MSHTNENVSIVITCIDYRFWEQALEIISEKYGKLDLISIAGGAKGLSSPSNISHFDTIIDNINISVKLHGAKRIILTNHVDCGAYGGSSNFMANEHEEYFHNKELKTAKKVINEKFPDLEVVMIFIKKNNDKIECIYNS